MSVFAYVSELRLAMTPLIWLQHILPLTQLFSTPTLPTPTCRMRHEFIPGHFTHPAPRGSRQSARRRFLQHESSNVPAAADQKDRVSQAVQTRPDQTSPDQTWPDQTRPDLTGGQTRPAGRPKGQRVGERTERATLSVEGAGQGLL